MKKFFDFPYALFVCHNAAVVVTNGCRGGGVTTIFGCALSAFRLLLPVLICRNRTPNGFALVATQEDIFERLPEHVIENRVKNWIDH